MLLLVKIFLQRYIFFVNLKKSCTFAPDFGIKNHPRKGARVVEEARLESE